MYGSKDILVSYPLWIRFVFLPTFWLVGFELDLQLKYFTLRILCFAIEFNWMGIRETKELTKIETLKE